MLNFECKLPKKKEKPCLNGDEKMAPSTEQESASAQDLNFRYSDAKENQRVQVASLQLISGSRSYTISPTMFVDGLLGRMHVTEERDWIQITTSTRYRALHMLIG
jgi:hypothetical protein